MTIGCLLSRPVIGSVGVALITAGFRRYTIANSYQISSVPSYLIAVVMGSMVGKVLGEESFRDLSLLRKEYACFTALGCLLHWGRFLRAPQMAAYFSTAILAQRIWMYLIERDIFRESARHMETRFHLITSSLLKGNIEGLRSSIPTYFLRKIDYRQQTWSFTKNVSGPWGSSKGAFLHYAAQAGSTEAINYLHESFHANLDIRTEPYGDTPLLIAIYHCRVDAVRLLLQLGADPKAKNYSQSTALHIAAIKLANPKDYEAALEIVQMMLEAGADKNEKNQFGETACSIFTDIKTTKGDLDLSSRSRGINLLSPSAS